MTAVLPRFLLLPLLLWWCLAAPARADSGDALLVLDRAHAEVQVDKLVQSGEVSLPYHWDRLHQTRGGWGQFELTFTLEDLPYDPWGAYLPRVGNAYRFWLNGNLLQEAGNPDLSNREDHAKSSTYVPIPAGLLQKHNTLRIEIRADDGRRGGLSPITLGPADQVLALHQEAQRWRVQVSMSIAVFSWLVALISLVLWITQDDPRPGQPRRDNTYLWAALAELCWSLRVGDVAITNPPIPWPWWGIVATASFAGWICCTALFCHHVAGWQNGRGMRWFSLGVAALFLSSVAASAISLFALEPAYLTAWLGLANLCFVAYALVYTVAAWRKPDVARWLVALVGCLNVAMGLRDWLAIRISGSLNDNTWIRYSSVLFGLTLVYIVVMRFREASAQAREARDLLAQRVREKELELQESYRRLEQLAREQERGAERARILRDMHDGVGAHISSAIRQLQSGRSSQGELLSTLRDSLDQLKLSIDAIHLPTGDITALLANLRYRLEPRLRACDIELEWAVDLIDPIPWLDAQAMRQLQFMVFEALSNVMQHAHARRVRIEAEAHPGLARVRLIDDGHGFDTRVPPRRGLKSMQERAQGIGVVLDLQSQPGRTVVAIGIPTGGANGAG